MSLRRNRISSWRSFSSAAIIIVGTIPPGVVLAGIGAATPVVVDWASEDALDSTGGVMVDTAAMAVAVACMVATAEATVVAEEVMAVAGIVVEATVEVMVVDTAAVATVVITKS